jgi:Lipoprotein LpqB beta-propeller domain/WD40-like Beta Propeller Repeat
MTMIDLRERFDAADEIGAPDVWADVERRAGSPTVDHRALDLRDGSRARLRRIATIAAAIAIAAIGIGFAVHEFRQPETTPLQQPPVGIFDHIRGFIVFPDAAGDLVAVDPSEHRAAGGRSPVVVQSGPPGSSVNAPSSWSADGAHLLMQDGTMLSSDGSRRQVGPSGRPVVNAALSPDGTRLAFMSRTGSLVEIDIGGGRDHRTLVPDTRQTSSSPTWSPDGTQIAFIAFGSGRITVSVVNADGSGLHVLTDLAGMQVGELGGLAWSPDGSTIAMSNSPSVSDGSQGEIWLVDADGSNLRRITGNDGSWWPTWSPDGQRLAVARNGDIYTMTKEGGDVRLVSQGALEGIWIAWNPA